MAKAPRRGPSRLDEFLAKNTIKSIEGKLPLVHSTKSLNLRELAEASGLEPTLCDIYGEELIYFFLGRPAYRWSASDGRPEHWELPTCFIFDDLPSLKIERTLPFDSGAYEKNRYPSFVQNIPRANFESEGARSANRIISAVYGSFSRYFQGRPKTEEQIISEFDLSPIDAEILSIRRLAETAGGQSFDDRCFSIEIQSRTGIDFSINPPSAIILPTVYLSDKNVASVIKGWSCEIITYDSYGLSLQLYFGAIFEKFRAYCEERGYSV